MDFRRFSGIIVARPISAVSSPWRRASKGEETAEIQATHLDGGKIFLS